MLPGARLEEVSVRIATGVAGAAPHRQLPPLGLAASPSNFRRWPGRRTCTKLLTCHGGANSKHRSGSSQGFSSVVTREGVPAKAF